MTDNPIWDLPVGSPRRPRRAAPKGKALPPPILPGQLEDFAEREWAGNGGEMFPPHPHDGTKGLGPTGCNTRTVNPLQPASILERGVTDFGDRYLCNGRSPNPCNTRRREGRPTDD